MKKTINSNKMINIITVGCLLLTLIVFPLSKMSTAYGSTSLSSLTATQQDDGTVCVEFSITYRGSYGIETPSATITYTDTEARTVNATLLKTEDNMSSCDSNRGKTFYYKNYVDITAPEGQSSFKIAFTANYEGSAATQSITYNVPQGYASMATTEPTATPTVVLIQTATPTQTATATPTPTATPKVTYKATATPTATAKPTATATPYIDTVAPVAWDNGNIYIDKRTDTTVDLYWSAATDNFTAQSDIKYIFYISSQNNINTVEQCEANGTAVNDYTANITSYTLSGLSPSTTYYINVVAKDAAGNKTAYMEDAMVQTTTTDTTAPTAGGSGALTVSDLTGSSAVVSWTKGLDDKTPTSRLEYALVYSLSSNISTVSDCHSNGIIGTYTENIASASLSGLTEGVTYYVNVLLRDWQGNESVYTMASFTPDGTAPTPGSSGEIIWATFSFTALDVAWTAGTDNVTAYSNLEYAVYYSSSSLSTVAQWESATKAMDYTANVTNTTITGLEAGTAYYVCVIVRDENGNKALYSAEPVSTPADIIAPTVGDSGTLSTASITGSGFTVSWSAATDDVSAQSALKYQVYYSTSDNISTVAACKSSGTSAGAYAANITSKAVTGLEDVTTYFINVIVCDEAGNESIYTSASATTLDGTAPTPGNGGTISVTYTSSTSLDLEWTAASDNVTAQSSIQYLVYFSESGNIDTVANCQAYGIEFGSFTANNTSMSFGTLTSGKTYYFNVVVMDEAGNKSCYTMVAGTP